MKSDFSFRLISRERDNLNAQPSWMVTYSDALSLLVTFFVMLVAFSDMSSSRMTNAIYSTRAQLGGSVQKKAISTNFRSVIPAFDLLIERLLITYGGTIQKSPKDMPFYFVRRKDVLAVILNGKEFFKNGTATPSEVEHKEFYMSLQSLIHFTSNSVRIISVLPEDTMVASEKTKTPWGLASERGLFIFSKIVEDKQRKSNISIGVIINSKEKTKKLLSDGIPDEQIQVVFYGLNDIEKILPKEFLYEE